MKIERVYTSGDRDPFAGIKFTNRNCEIREDDVVVFSAKGWLFPESWSQSACDIAAQKYFRRASGDFAGERDLRQVIHRIAGCWRYWGERLGYFSSEEDAQAFYDEHCYLLARQMASPNSPQWFNTGLHWSYGIAGSPQGHTFIDEKTGEARRSPNAYERPQVHACFIQSISDDLVNPMGIMDLWVREARVFKFGSGTGTNFSSLRAAGEMLDGAGASSGLMAFLRVGDVAAGSVKSGGVTRRAAKMVCLDLDHPEILDFVRWKALEETKLAQLIAGSNLLKRGLDHVWKAAHEGRLTDAAWGTIVDDFRSVGLPLSLAEQARDLGRQGVPLQDTPVFNADWRGEGYRAIFGQNANTSVRVPSSFLEALGADGTWELKARKGGKVVARVAATELWSEIARAAWACADPGVQFESIIDEWHTCPQSGPIRASNPCSEYLFLDDTGCNLASINLIKFWDPASRAFDATGFAHACRLYTMALDISVSMAQYPSQQIAERSVAFRTLGLGFANLGALVMASGHAYDSEEGRALTSTVSSLMAASAWKTSAEMAAELGTFSEYEKNKAAVLRVLKNHGRAAGIEKEYDTLTVKPRPIAWNKAPAEVVQFARETWSRARELVKQHGVRNAQLTAIAPTGTIGIVMDCDTTGIEPEYSLMKMKTLAGGGTLSSTNRTVSLALWTLGYPSEQIAAIEQYLAKYSALVGAPHIRKEHYPVFDCAQVSGPSGKRISVEGHLGMLAAAQPFISGGISKTVSLPSDATIDDVKSVFGLAHSWMIKCVALFREGSKLSQPLAVQRTATTSPEICFECG